MRAFYSVHSFGQLPTECTVQGYTGVCCPNVGGFGACGGPSRGRCESISNDYPTYDCNSHANENTRYCKAEALLRTRAVSPAVVDLRYKWPSQIFHSVCKCNEEYSGYNCMRCNRGYRQDGNNCVKHDTTTLPTRKNFVTLSNEEQNEFMEILEMAKNSRNFGYAYAVPIHQPILGTQSFVTVSLYDAFTTYHYYSNRDKPIVADQTCNNGNLQRFCSEDMCLPDFAHWGPAFLTWHRGYLLCFENEIRYMLSQMDRTGKYYTADNFALHYWDWSDDDTARRDRIWSITGHNMNSRGNIQGRFATWKIICNGHANDLCLNDRDRLCDPTQLSTIIQRSIGGIDGRQCLARTSDESEESSPSSRKDFISALNQHSFDEDPYWYKTYNGGFRNALEGFAELGNHNQRSEVCPMGAKWPFFELHNRLHLYVGGTMSDIVISSNDPIFYLHHSNVDRMYETWLQKYNGPYKPQEFSYKVAPGHNVKESLIMLFPKITNEDMHKKSKELGYKYDVLAAPISTSKDKGFGIHNRVYEVHI